MKGETMTTAEQDFADEARELRELAGLVVETLAGRPDFVHVRDCALECCIQFDRAKREVERERQQRHTVDVGRN